MKTWFNKFDKKKRKGSLDCPNCGHHFDERILYLIEPNICPSCKNDIGFIDLSPYHSVIFTIDLNRCPELIKKTFYYLTTQNQKEGYEQLKELFFMITYNTESP